ncbi:MAG: response regulator, partial [Deltaproteobacteria bacterium]|nr:response regulator [Deltaproteobacteria bacterium]
KMIPVVILTTSRAKQDIRDSFSFGAAGYMVKPLDYREFVDAVVTIARYWRLSELPE